MNFNPLFENKMSPVLVAIAFCLFLFTNKIDAQENNAAQKAAKVAANEKKYTSLLWEITGNGLKKPSYLFGTMHISNKLVFNLGDSFYNAVKSVDVVALEQNPEVWQEELSKSDEEDDYDYNDLETDGLSLYDHERLTRQTFAVSPYESKIKMALASEARMVNSLLYRNQIGQEDFEEETYLDMYIYRLGCKLHKTVTGVEDYKESNRIVKEAYLAMYKDRNLKRNVRFDYNDQIRIEDAYRRGDLDLLDSIQVVNIRSEAFHQKFMYKRNEIQANSIDTIIKKHALFVGVGAAHLPGNRGVIELLRKKGYTLRPVIMGKRNSAEKESLERIRVPVTFSRQFSDDSVFSVKIPGKNLYRYGNYFNLDMVQYADMPNGSYYLVTRVKTDAGLWGHSTNTVLKKIDSLLYENIPGTILSKKTIVKNGFAGYDIINKTRKGNEQRYNIYVLPEEIIIFKIAGLDNYVTKGPEAEQFFSSVSFDTAHTDFQPVTYKCPYGGFKATFPSKPYFTSQKLNYSRNEWLSKDEKGNVFFVFKTNLHHYDYIEEDTFELRLMEESFVSSSLFKSTPGGETSSWNKYPVLNAEYVHTDGSNLKVRYLIQGNNYYIIGVKQKYNAAAEKFINSFSFTPFNYGDVKMHADTALGFTVNSPLFYKINTDTSKEFSWDDLNKLRYNYGDDDETNPYFEAINTTSRKVIGNDTTGEYIDLVSVRLPKYEYFKDSVNFFKKIFFESPTDSDYVIKWNKNFETPSNWKCHYYQLSDTGSSRIITVKAFYKNGVLFYLSNMSDTITAPGYFVQNFFETFAPADTFKTVDPFKKKSKEFFADYFNTDSIIHKKAVRALSASIFDSSDLPLIKKAIDSLSWKNKNYLSLKKEWIDVIGSFHDTVSVNYLSQLYHNVKDTSELQNAILDALLDMRTLHSFTTFKDLITTEPPALTSNYPDYNIRMPRVVNNSKNSLNKRYSDYGIKWGALYDTLSLSRNIIPQMLDLITLDDYKDYIINVLAAAVDSGYINPDEYKQYFNKFLLDAKQQLKKQVATEEKNEMNKLSKKDNYLSYDYDANDYYGYEGSDLINYAVLLTPFWERSEEVPSFFTKLLQLRNKQIKLETCVLLLRNKKAVPDSILQSLAADNTVRARLYNSLKEYNLLDKFPMKYKNQSDIACSILFDNSSYLKIDSMVYFNKLPVNQGRYKGWLYFFKYKTANDDEWKIAASGLQPFDSTKINSDVDSYEYDLVQFTDEEFKGPLNEKLQKICKECLYSLRKSSAYFYKDDEHDHDEAVVEAVKERRYE